MARFNILLMGNLPDTLTEADFDAAIQAAADMLSAKGFVIQGGHSKFQPAERVVEFTPPAAAKAP